MSDIHFIKLPRDNSPKKFKGVARIVEMGFDLERLERYVVYELDPPQNGERFMKTHYADQDLNAETGETLPRVIDDERERVILRRIPRAIGYELIEDGSERKGDN